MKLLFSNINQIITIDLNCIHTAEMRFLRDFLNSLINLLIWDKEVKACNNWVTNIQYTQFIHITQYIYSSANFLFKK